MLLMTTENSTDVNPEVIACNNDNNMKEIAFIIKS